MIDYSFSLSIYIDLKKLRPQTSTLMPLLKEVMTITSKWSTKKQLYVSLILWMVSSPPFAILPHTKASKSRTVLSDGEKVVEKQENLDEYDLADPFMWADKLLYMYVR